MFLRDQAVDARFEDLLHYDIAMSASSSTWRKALEDAAERMGRTLTPCIETESMQAMKALAASGACRALMPGSCVLEDARRGLLSIRRVVEPGLQGMKSLASLSSRPLGLAQQRVRAIIQEVAAEITREQRLPEPHPATGIFRTTPTPFTAVGARTRHLERAVTTR